ncbi:MAG TPA: DNA ligase [Bacilli bacterium]
MEDHPRTATLEHAPWTIFPFEPMTPILHDELPLGPDWAYQLKWDGVRLLAGVRRQEVRLFSRNMLPKNAVYPELAAALASLGFSGVLDGEAVIFDPEKQKPDFAKILQRERMSGVARNAGAKPPGVTYAVFDLLVLNGRDIRPLPCEERHRLLKKSLPQQTGNVLVVDFFANGAALWDWVSERGWEGVVSKKLSSPYRSGKRHADWFKKKISLTVACAAVGALLREGGIASLVLAENGAYLGKVSGGVTEAIKSKIARGIAFDTGGRTLAQAPPFRPLPAELRRERVVWFEQPLACTVSALERTDSGGLRHPKLRSIDL